MDVITYPCSNINKRILMKDYWYKNISDTYAVQSGEPVVLGLPTSGLDHDYMGIFSMSNMRIPNFRLYQWVYSARPLLHVCIQIPDTSYAKINTPPGQNGRHFLRRIFSDAFLCIKSFVFWLKFHWSLLQGAQLITSKHLLEPMPTEFIDAIIRHYPDS